MSKLISPSCWPEYSRLAIWNGPSTVPSSGTITRQFRSVPLKKYWRTVSSVLASLKMPLPVMRAVFTPAPSSSSRQRPTDSVSVTSTVAALKASVRAQSGNRHEAPCPIGIDLEQQVLTLLRRHARSSCSVQAKEKAAETPPS
jgi:hypothetical protein